MKISVVSISQVPPTNGVRGASRAALLYTQLQDLKRGEAMRVEFENVGQGKNTLTNLKKIAKAEGYRLGASREGDGKVRFFWLEME